MPVRFWEDPDGARYRAAYFDVYPGVWRSGRHVYGSGFVALAAASELRSPARLRSDLRAAGL